MKRGGASRNTRGGTAPVGRGAGMPASPTGPAPSMSGPTGSGGGFTDAAIANQVNNSVTTPLTAAEAQSSVSKLYDPVMGAQEVERLFDHEMPGCVEVPQGPAIFQPANDTKKKDVIAKLAAIATAVQAN